MARRAFPSYRWPGSWAPAKALSALALLSILAGVLSISTSGLKPQRASPFRNFLNATGEPAFRQLEADQLRAALGRSIERAEPTVLALGGRHLRTTRRSRVSTQFRCAGDLVGCSDRGFTGPLHYHDRTSALPRRGQLPSASWSAHLVLPTRRFSRRQFRRPSSRRS